MTLVAERQGKHESKRKGGRLGGPRGKAYTRERYLLLADEDLISLIPEGDAVAFGVLYDRHARPCYSLAYRLVGEKQRAEDILQDAFLRVWRRANTYRPERGSVRTWLLSIVHNRALDELRSSISRNRTWEKASFSAEKYEPCEAFAVTSRNVLREKLRDVLETLPPEQLETLRLAYYAGYTHVEIAELLDLPLGTVKGRMRLASKKLADHFRHGEIAVAAR